MFEQHFGLTKRPFDGLAEGADVFVGPQTAALVRKAKKVFAAPDSVICVTGPVGAGKTTLVGRSLSALGRQHTIIRIGRIKLGPDEVLDFLLRELGLQQMPAGTIQKITVFRSVLKKLEDNDIRLFVIVEDADRLGNVALQELEALTATDSGVSEGANLVLMSEEPLRTAMQAPGLRRLKQRSRLHFALEPMSAPEVRGYLTHGLRQAGGNLSGILTDDAVLSAHALSEGIPRVVNNLVSSALESAADKGMQRLDAPEIERVAAEEFGIDVDSLSAAGSPVADTATRDERPATAEAQAAIEKTATPEPEIAPETAPETGIELPAPAVEASRPAVDAESAETSQDDPSELIDATLPEITALDSGEYPIPDLIQDTLPDLEVLAPEMAKPPEVKASPGLEAEPRSDQDLPDLPGIDDLPTIDDLPEFGDAPNVPAPAESADALELPVVDEPAATQQIPRLEIPELASDTDLPLVNEPMVDEPIVDEPIVDEPMVDEPMVDEPVAAADVPSAAVPELASDADLDDIPTLFDSSPGMEAPAPVIEESHVDPVPVPPAEVPAWDRDPTMAELKPDLEALERAMAVAHGLNKDDADEPAAKEAAEPEVVPEITLDDSIRRKIDIAEAALAATQNLDEDEFGDETDINIDIDVDAGAEAPPAVEKSKTVEIAEDLGRTPARADAELERIAAELAKAKSIEDVDDAMAETLFGEEFSLIAAEVAANGPAAAPGAEPAAEPVASPASEVSGDPANDTIVEEPLAELSLAQTGASIKSPAHDDAPSADGESDLERQFKDLYGEDALEVSMETTPHGMDLSASQRLATVRALNAGSPGAADAGAQSKQPKAKRGPRPDSIEDQIDTSITQTLKGLDPAKIKQMQAAEAEEEQQKSGFFSRFRRS